MTTSTELQHLLSCVKFCTNTESFISALLQTHPPYLQALPRSHESETTWNTRQQEAPTHSRNFQQRQERWQAQHRQSQWKVLPGLRKRMHAPNSPQLVTPASTALFPRERIAAHNRRRALHRHRSSPLLQPTAGWHTQQIYHRHMTTYFKYQRALC